MVEGASTYADVGLYAKVASLSDVDSCAEFEQVVDGLYFRTFNVFACDDRNALSCFGKSDGHACSRHFGCIKGDVFPVGFSVAQHAGFVSLAFAVGVGKHAGCQGADAYFSFQTVERCIALPCEVLEEYHLMGFLLGL